jgi:hypothetical protein
MIDKYLLCRSVNKLDSVEMFCQGRRKFGKVFQGQMMAGGWKHGRAINMDVCYILSSGGKILGWSKAWVVPLYHQSN